MRRKLAPPLYSLALALVALAALEPAVCEAGPCWRYTDSDSCSSYPLTDFSVARPLPGAKGSPTREVDFSTSLGWLFVASDRVHAGPALLVSLYLDGGWHSQLGVQGRLRFLATPSIHLDLTPGLILIDSPYPGGFAGYSLEVACGYRDWISLASRLDVVDEGPNDSQTVVQIGFRFGSYPGLALSAAGAAVGGIGYVWSRMD
jgi:hypothetical protein